MNSLKQFLQDGGGNLSSTRLALLIIVLGVVVKNVYLTIHTGQSVPLQWEDVSVVVGAFAAKTAQKAWEPTGETPAPTPPAPVKP